MSVLRFEEIILGKQDWGEDDDDERYIITSPISNAGGTLASVSS